MRSRRKWNGGEVKGIFDHNKKPLILSLILSILPLLLSLKERIEVAVPPVLCIGGKSKSPVLCIG